MRVDGIKGSRERLHVQKQKIVTRDTTSQGAELPAARCLQSANPITGDAETLLHNAKVETGIHRWRGDGRRGCGLHVVRLFLMVAVVCFPLLLADFFKTDGRPSWPLFVSECRGVSGEGCVFPHVYRLAVLVCPALVVLLCRRVSLSLECAECRSRYAGAGWKRQRLKDGWASFVATCDAEISREDFCAAGAEIHW